MQSLSQKYVTAMDRASIYDCNESSKKNRYRKQGFKILDQIEKREDKILLILEIVRLSSSFESLNGITGFCLRNEPSIAKLIYKRHSKFDALSELLLDRWDIDNDMRASSEEISTISTSYAQWKENNKRQYLDAINEIMQIIEAA